MKNYTKPCYEQSPPTLGALIVAAGMSSRMGAFKPMLPIGNRSMTECLIASFRNWGADPIVVVTGHRSDELERHLSGSGVELVHNPYYKNTQMWDSFKLGTARLTGRCDFILFCPADVPLDANAVIDKLMEENAPVVAPTCQGRDGHPVLISAALLEDICAYDGEGGLRGFLQRVGRSVKRVKVEDACVLRDTDTPEDYMRLVRENDPLRQVGCRPDMAECLSLLIKYGTPPDTILHCVAVAELARKLSEKLKRAGVPLDIPLIYGAALLHDISREFPEHAATGAKWLRQEGYDTIASIMEYHMELSQDDLNGVGERMVVFYADKRVQGRIPVSIEERFKDSQARISCPEAIKAHTRRWHQAQVAERLIRERLNGISGNRNLPVEPDLTVCPSVGEVARNCGRIAPV